LIFLKLPLYFCNGILYSNNNELARLWWLPPVILATQEAEIRKTAA
jgi:hypothetical protein